MNEKAVIVVRFNRQVTEPELAALENWVDQLAYYLPTRYDEFSAGMFIDDWEPPDG